MARGGVPDHWKALRRLLARNRWPVELTRQRRVSYQGPADFLLEHGERFEPRPLPREYEHLEPNKCFWNALVTAVVDGLDYVEGFTLSHFGDAYLHAWNVDEDGHVVERTWRARSMAQQRQAAALAYIGVRFTADRADDCSWDGDACVVNDFRRGWPLLREPWIGPDRFTRQPSPHMKVLLTMRDHGMDAGRWAYHQMVEEHRDELDLAYQQGHLDTAGERDRHYLPDMLAPADESLGWGIGDAGVSADAERDSSSSPTKEPPSCTV